MIRYSEIISTHCDPAELCIDPFIVTTHLCGLRHSRVRAKKKSTRGDVYFHLHTKLLTSYRSMYEVGTYNSEAVAAARWLRCKMAARGKVAACGSSAVGQGGGDGGGGARQGGGGREAIF